MDTGKSLLAWWLASAEQHDAECVMLLSGYLLLLVMVKRLPPIEISQFNIPNMGILNIKNSEFL